jgi:hypothetical protein
MTVNQRTEKAGRTRPSQLLAAALVIYGTLFLLLLAAPASVVSWLQGLKTNAVQQRVLRAAEAVQVVSDRIGLSVPFQRARAAFLKDMEDQ